MLPDDVLASVDAHLLRCLGPDSGRGKVTFVGATPIEVVRFGPRPDGAVAYVTVGMSAAPMTDPLAPVVDPDAGPRAELWLRCRRSHDDVLRPLATLASMPAVEGVVVEPGATYDLGGPLVVGSRCTGVLVDDPRPELPELPFPDDHGAEAIRFLPVVPLTPEEAAYKRVHGAAALWEQWHREQTDLSDLRRRGVRLELPRGGP